MNRIKLFGRCNKDSEMSVYANQILVFEGKIDPVKTDTDYDEYLLAEFNVADSANHNTKIKVVCNNEMVSVGTVDTNFCQDINTELSLSDRQYVWQCRRDNANTYPEVAVPYLYYSNDGGEFADHTRLEKHGRNDERINIVLNGKPIDLRSKPDYPGLDSWTGWFYYLEENQVVTFDVNVFLPLDYLTFIVDQQITQEDFNEILFSTR